MCCDGCTIVFPAFITILAAHWWIWSLNRQNIVSEINVFGYTVYDISISDIFAVTAISTCILLAIIEIYSWCRTCTSNDPRSAEIYALKTQKKNIAINIRELQRKVAALMKVTDRIKLLIPYDLNTMVEAQMFDHIPNVTFSPTRVTVRDGTATAGIHFADSRFTGRTSSHPTHPNLPPNSPISSQSQSIQHSQLLSQQPASTAPPANPNPAQTTIPPSNGDHQRLSVPMPSRERGHSVPLLNQKPSKVERKRNSA